MQTCNICFEMCEGLAPSGACDGCDARESAKVAPRLARKLREAQDEIFRLRKLIHLAHSCAHCGADLIVLDTRDAPPHCEFCNLSDEEVDDWEARVRDFQASNPAF